MSGWHQYADRYPISSWLLGCMEKEINHYVETERNRIIKLLEQDADNNYYALQLIKGEQK